MLKRLFHSIFTISFFTAVSRIFGFIRDILIARYLGVSTMSDIFFAAFRLPNFFRRIFAEGAFNSAFVPIFVAKNSKNKKSAQNFVCDVFSLLLYIVLTFVLILQIFMPFVMRIFFPGFYEDNIKFDILVNMSRITIFYLVFISLVSLMSGILNSLSKFAIPSSAPIILNLTLIFALFYISSITPNYAYALSWGVFLAGILQFLWIFSFTIKAGFLLYPKIPKINHDIKNFFRKLLPAIIGANVMQINLLIDSIFASLTFGSLSYLYYADRVNQLPLALIGIAIGVVLLPKLSYLIKQKKDEEALNLQNLAIKIGFLLVMPASFGLMLLSYDIIHVLFERGNFTNLETINVAKALSLYALALPAYVMVKILEPSFFARGNTKTPMKIALICLSINVIANILFYNLSFGFYGIIIASIIASYFNLILILRKLILKKYFQFKDFNIKTLFKLVVPPLLMLFSLLLINNTSLLKNYLNPQLLLLFEIIFSITSYILYLYIFGFYNYLKKLL